MLKVIEEEKTSCQFHLLDIHKVIVPVKPSSTLKEEYINVWCDGKKHAWKS